jgi:hypothetical protein
MIAAAPPRSAPSFGHRLFWFLVLVAGAIGVGLALSALHYVGVANAGGLAQPITDPVTTATAATSDGWDVVAHAGPIWGGSLLVYGIAQAFLRRNQSEHWIAQGRALAVITATVMVAGGLFDWHFRGAPIGSVLAVAIAAISLVWHPTVTPLADAPDPSAASSGAVAGLLIVALVGGSVLGIGVACGPVKSAGAAVLDCAKLDVDKIAAIAEAAAGEVAAYLVAGKKPDWDKIIGDAEHEGLAIGLCAVAPIVNKYLAPPPGRAAPAPEDGIAARTALERMRAQAGVTTIRTLHDGDL